MEGFLNRYRNITVLLLVIFAQLLLLAVQVKNAQDVRMIRVWTVTAVTPAARLLEALRGGGLGFFRNYIALHNTNEENVRLRQENGRLKLENIFLKNELNRADRAKALELFQSRTPSKMVAATIIAAGAGSNSKVVFVDRGTVSGVMRGMPVVTPDGIVGIVRSAYPTASEILLVTDPDFAAGAISQKGQVRGTVKGQGTPLCKLDYVPPGAPIEPGDWLYTSGEDHVFPRGFAVGVVKSVRTAQPFKEISVEPSGLRQGLEDVLILVQGTHHEIPDTPPPHQPVYISPLSPAGSPTGAEGDPSAPPDAVTEADKLRAIYKAVGDAQAYTFGDGGVGSKPADFTRLPATPPSPGAAAASSTAPGTQVPAGGAAGGGTTGPRPSGSGPSTAPGAQVPPSGTVGRGISEPRPSGSGPAAAVQAPGASPPTRGATGVQPPSAGPGARGATGSTAPPPKAPAPPRKSDPAPGAPGGPSRK